MRCSKCGTNNPSGNNFCAQCGNALLRLCAKCGAENPPASNFCGKCGARRSCRSDSRAHLRERATFCPLDPFPGAGVSVRLSDRYIWRYVKPNNESLADAIDQLD